MYKTVVYALINGGITHKNSRYHKKSDVTQHDIA